MKKNSIKLKKRPNKFQANGNNKALASRSNKKYKKQEKYIFIKVDTNSTSEAVSFNQISPNLLELDYSISDKIEISNTDSSLISLRKISANLFEAQKSLSFPLKLKKSKVIKPEEPKKDIRISNYRPKLANKEKKKYLSEPLPILLDETQKVIDKILYQDDIPKLLPKSITDSISLPLRLAQVVGKAASANVRSIKSKVDKANEAEKKKKYQLEILNSYNNHEIKLTLRDLNLELDKRFILIEENKGNKKGKASKIDGKTVDYWIKVISFPNNSFYIPLFLTNHMKSLIKRGYSVELDHARINSNGTIGIFFSKEIKPYNEKVNPIKAVGIDLGRDTLVACSDNSRETTHKTGKPVKEIIFNISRKKSGSNNQKRAIKFLRNQVNYSVKHDINWARIDDIFIENLKDMKRHKKWGRQSHFWPVSYVRKQIKNISRENDVRLTEVYAAGTSQECNVCGFQHKKNRIDERFECLNCREKADANNQASVNIFFRGANSPSYKKRVRNNKIYEPISVDLLPEVKSATGISVIFRAFDEGGVSYTDLRKCMK